VCGPGHVLKDPNIAINACGRAVEVDADIDALLRVIKGN
jgi:threonine synthase